MNNVVKVVAAIVVLWIVFSIIGAIVGFLAHLVLWLALIAGAVVLVGAIAGSRTKSIGGRRTIGRR